MSCVYDIDFRRLVLLLLPTFLRRPRLVAFVSALISPLSGLHPQFLRYRADTLWRLDHNSQVCYLRGALNDLLDPVERRITVLDVPPSHGLTLVPERETGQPLLMPSRTNRAVIVGRRGFTIGGYDFMITIPAGVDADRARAVADEFKLASKRFITVI
jgi:hypothetical protein